MFAVAGRWRLDPTLADQQDEGRTRIVEGVRNAPGFIEGFWSRDLDLSVNLTYVVFGTLEDAEHFRGSVRENAPAQQAAGVWLEDLRVVEVIAHAAASPVG